MTFMNTQVDNFYIPQTENSSFRFISISAGLHVFLIFLAGLIAAQKVEKIPDPITIEIISKGDALITKAGAAAKASPKMISGKEAFKTKKASPVVKIKPNIARANDIHSVAVPIPKLRQPKVSQIKPLFQKDSFVVKKVVALKASLDDIENPDLDVSKVKFKKTSLNDKELLNDFKNIKKETAQKFQKDVLDKEFTNVQAENAKFAEETESQLQSMQQNLLEKKKDADSKKQALLKEGYGAAHIATTESSFAGFGDDDKSKSTLGSSGGLAASDTSSGSARSGVAGKQGSPQGLPSGNSKGAPRQLSQLTQVTGNVKPKYSDDDRFNKREGTVSFLAYIGADGSIQKLNLKKSSNHKSLDLKAYAAVQNWRFVPGQEGWVEIPIVWSLKGLADYTGPLLRRTL